MRINNSKKAYTLAEIMIVLLILTVIFAAFAPFFTKRISGKGDKSGIWSWVNGINHNAIKTESSGQVFFGVSPTSQDDNDKAFAPASKVVIRSGINGEISPQRQMQFRYGPTVTAPEGQFAGSWLANGKNILLGGAYRDIKLDEARNNVSIGYYSLNSITKAAGNVAIGYRSLQSTTYGINNVAVGAGAGYFGNKNNRVIIGYNAGGSNVGNQISIGYEAASSASGSIGMANNIYIGAFAGLNSDNYNNGYMDSLAPKQNIGIGYRSLNNITEGNNNVAIGAHALENLTTGYNNTAIGYGACAEVGEASNKTCIGYNSGPHISRFFDKELLYKKDLGVDDRYSDDKGIFATDWVHNNVFEANQLYNELYPTSPRQMPANIDEYNLGISRIKSGDLDKKSVDGRNVLKAGLANDSQMRTYIGSKPYNYGGDAVLEIHNLNTNNEGYMGLVDTSPFNVTTIVNGNLIVRGRTYFTVGSTLHHFYDGMIDDTRSKMQLTYRNDRYNVTSYYGYISTTDPYYAKCTTESGTYSFGNKCINLKTKTSSSDRRLKNILSKNTAGLDKLRKLKVYNFTFKNDKNKIPQVGVLAQELMKVFPTAVFQDENGYYKIRWDEMFFAVINSIKQIDKRIVTVVKKMTGLESQITKLESENIVLKSQVENLTRRVNRLKAQ